MSSTLLTLENSQKGFLVDEEWMAGVTENTEKKGEFAAFILSHATGEYVAYHLFESLEAAIAALNRIPRQWSFEAVGGCGSGNCGQGNCGKEGGACSLKSGGCCT